MFVHLVNVFQSATFTDQNAFDNGAFDTFEVSNLMSFSSPSNQYQNEVEIDSVKISATGQ